MRLQQQTVSAKTVLMRFLSWIYPMMTIHTKRQSVFCARLPNLLISLQLRYTPELTFVRDDSIDQGAHILDMLRNPNVVKPANPANEHIHLDEE